MMKLPQVEDAKALMTEAMTWSVMKWLREKKNVRRAADEANGALDQLSLQLKQGWPDDIRAAYNTLIAESAGTRRRTSGKNGTFSGANADEALVQKMVAQEIKDADDEAYQARMNAEEAFDEAEKKLSTRVAREGCVKAIRAWELQEKAIDKSANIHH